MATPNYFSKFPDIKYGVKMNKSGVIDYITIKDYFNHVVMRDYEFSRGTLLTPYYIKNGERPDQISYNEYEDEQYYWIILHVNDIVDYYQEWPLSQYELDRMIVRKYGSIEAAEDIHHYETIEIKDEWGSVLLPGRGSLGPDRGGIGRSGLVVSEDYSFTYPTYPGSQIYITKSGSRGTNAVCTPITNRQYEYDLNEDKSQVWILNKTFLPDFLRDLSKYTAGLKDQQSSLDVSDFE